MKSLSFFRLKLFFHLDSTPQVKFWNSRSSLTSFFNLICKCFLLMQVGDYYLKRLKALRLHLEIEIDVQLTLSMLSSRYLVLVSIFYHFIVRPALQKSPNLHSNKNISTIIRPKYNIKETAKPITFSCI